MINRILCIGAALGALGFIAGSAPVSAAPVVTGFARASTGAELVQEVGYRRRYYRDHGTYVRAPFTEVDTRRGTWVAAPFVRVYSGRRGTWVRAPFVNLWSPH